MLDTGMLRVLLRVVSVISILLVIAQLGYAARTFDPTNLQTAQFAEFGLALVFVAFLNLIVWAHAAPTRTARRATHFCNVLLLIVSAITMKSVAGINAYLLFGCSAALAVIALLFEVRRRKTEGGWTDGGKSPAQSVH